MSTMEIQSSGFMEPCASMDISLGKPARRSFLAQQKRKFSFQFVEQKKMKKNSFHLFQFSFNLTAFCSLAYLHEAIEPKVVHRDIKSSNILIDDDFNAKVSDFGLAKLLGAGKSHVTTRVMGTFGLVFFFLSLKFVLILSIQKTL